MSRPTARGALVAVLRHELRRYFLSPAAWVFLAGVLFLAALFFQLSLASTGDASLRAVLPNWAVTLVFCIPLLTMRQLAEEDRAGTLEMLFAAPLPLGALILGKWLATCVLCGVLLVGALPMAAVLWLYGNPDPAVLLTTWLGLGLCCGAFAAAGLFASSLTRDPMVAGVGGVLLLLPFWLAGAGVGLVPLTVRPWVQRLSLTDHLRPFAVGVLDTGAVAWFVAFTLAFLFLTWRSLEARRWA